MGARGVLGVDALQLVGLGERHDAARLATEVPKRFDAYDLTGALVLPGFQDGHNHLIWSATEQQDIDLFMNALYVAAEFGAVGVRRSRTPAGAASVRRAASRRRTGSVP